MVQDNLQSMEVPRVPGEKTAVDNNANGIWTINLGNLKSHNLHVRAGEACRRGCPLYHAHMGKVLTQVGTEVARPEVVPSPGGDKERDSPPTHANDRWPNWPKQE